MLKVVIFSILGGNTEGVNPSISAGGDPIATKILHQAYSEILHQSVKVNEDASMPWKKVITALRI